MRQLVSQFEWADLFSQAVLLLFGAALVYFTNRGAEARRLRTENEARRRHEQSIYVGMFSVCNVLKDNLALEDSGTLDRSKLPALCAAQRSLHQIIEKSAPDSQHFSYSIFDLSLKLDLLLSLAEDRADQLLEKSNPRFVEAYDGLVTALMTVDVMFEASLSFVTEGELSGFSQFVEPTDPAS